MRDIKFRIYDKLSGKVIYITGFRYVNNRIEYTFIDRDGNTCTCTREKSEIEIMQYTGLHDRNGKEIYEGDIVSSVIRKREYVETDDFGNKFYSDTKEKAVWNIEYKERFSGKGNGFYFYGKDRRFNIAATQGTITNCDCEIIGNIYDNFEQDESVKQ